MVRAVLFDAGETLLHPRPSFPDLFAAVAGDAGVVLRPEDVRDAGAAVSDLFLEAARDGTHWTTSPERSHRFWIAVYSRFLAELGVASYDGLPESLYRTFSDRASYELFPDVPAALEGLDRSGLRLGLVSNFEAWLDDLLADLGIRERFSAIAISGLEGIEKPDPEIFRRALDRAGVDASETAYVGDSPTFDCEPAASLGMLPVLLDRTDRFPKHRGPRIGSLDELPEVLR